MNEHSITWYRDTAGVVYSVRYVYGIGRVRRPSDGVHVIDSNWQWLTAFFIIAVWDVATCSGQSSWFVSFRAASSLAS